VVGRQDPGAHATGGNFSCGYRVVHENGTHGFLKALDFSRALSSPDPALALQGLTQAFNFERNLLNLCNSRRMDRIVRAITDGIVKVDNSLLGNVQYLVFEFADCDLRAQLSLASNVETAWKMRSLHHIATGLHQLHGADIAHQDLKPSNVLVFNGTESKIADLGSASLKGSNAPRDGHHFPGDPAYAPPEGLYGYVDTEWGFRRLGCDAYLLGSMVVFLFTGLSMTSLVQDELDPSFHWRNWTGTYQDVAAHVRDAFGRAVEVFGNHIPEEPLRDELKQIVRQLCDPDPRLRGHPLNRLGSSNPLSLERFVSHLDLLTRRAELGVFPTGKGN
jgi:eukaryotic-like serine/threonine-protein kinase